MTDNQGIEGIGYTVNGEGTPSLTNKGGVGLPGQSGAAIRARAAAEKQAVADAYAAESNAAAAKSAAQLRIDSSGGKGLSQHSPVKAASKAGKSGGRRGK